MNLSITEINLISTIVIDIVFIQWSVFLILTRVSGSILGSKSNFFSKGNHPIPWGWTFTVSLNLLQIEWDISVSPSTSGCVFSPVIYTGNRKSKPKKKIRRESFLFNIDSWRTIWKQITHTMWTFHAFILY